MKNREKERKIEKKRENERKRERKREKEREKKCSGSIIINLHSILKKKKLYIYIGRNAQNLEKLPDQ